MKKVFANPNFAIVKMAHDVLVQNEVGCLIKNEQLANMAGELPWTEVWPEVWIKDERQLDLARRLLGPFEGEADPLEQGAPWTCASCGEAVEAQFTDCWSCGAPRPNVE